MVWKGWRPAPLSSSFMLIAIIGLLISGYWVYPKSLDWGITFMILFTCMFIASLLSMVHAPLGNEWSIETKRKGAKMAKKKAAKKKRKR